VSWLRREDLEDLELHHLSRFAARSREHGGRRVQEPEDPLRTAFQRDRDRILHSRAFRRLQHKTQVFAAYEGDHYRTRLTHSLEVAQMARSVAIALRLNVDLCEAVALAHDLGHPPFGHAGEEALAECMAAHGGFRHNAQGVRIVDLLEDRGSGGAGLNLSREVRRALLKGQIPDGFPVSPDLLPRGTPPLEARIVDLCDRIAYLCHDVDDGLRAGILRRDAVAELALWRAASAAAGATEPPRVISEMVSLLIHDLVEASDRELASAPRVAHGEALARASAECLEFLRGQFYRDQRVLAAMQRGRERIQARFTHLLQHPDELPEFFRRRIALDGPQRAVCDYLAGMTDRYLLKQG
jgi:dGTPase